MLLWLRGRAIGNFAVTFTIISVLTGVTTTFNTGLTYGGPLTMVYGWPIAGTLTLFVGLAMAEICSAYPTSGGLYYWSSKLCGNEWSPFASWITGWYGSPLGDVCKSFTFRWIQLCHSHLGFSTEMGPLWASFRILNPCFISSQI